MSRKKKRYFKDESLLNKHGNNKIFIWNSSGYYMNIIITDRNVMTIDELAYMCIKSNKGSFISLSKVYEEALEQNENPDFYENRFYDENECYCYCDLSQYGLENGHCYHALTKSGKKAYYKLEDILTALCLMGVIDNDVYLIMDLLDQIIELEI